MAQGRVGDQLRDAVVINTGPAPGSLSEDGGADRDETRHSYEGTACFVSLLAP